MHHLKVICRLTFPGQSHPIPANPIYLVSLPLLISLPFSIGVAVMLAVIICGQILASLLFDRFGLLGLPVRELSTPRLLGAVLVLIGVLLVSFGDRLR